MTDPNTQADRASNRLITEASPYLLQHAKNPVEWYPWGEEALSRSKAEDKPILLSIGYSACHWCHVMAHESFENVEIAGLMNQDFINVKVDREERPDLDDIYQKSAQVFLGRGGGWPLTMFLTPDQELATTCRDFLRSCAVSSMPIGIIEMMSARMWRR
jgi:uncharacterized protein YyaL (SSP411 family)